MARSLLMNALEFAAMPVAYLLSTCDTSGLTPILVCESKEEAEQAKKESSLVLNIQPIKFLKAQDANPYKKADG